MRYIIKGQSPQDLIDWLNGQFIEGRYLNCRFDSDLDPEVKATIKQKLLHEQGWLCCYTGLSIDLNTSHFEHLYPQALSRRRGTHEDVDYQNMLVAYPKDGKCSFGAMARGDTMLLVHPLQSDCGSKFCFDIAGNISGVDNNAKLTIKTLKLEQLSDERKAAIDEVLFPDGIPLTRDDFQIIDRDYSKPDDNGRLRKLCFVISYIAHELLKL